MNYRFIPAGAGNTDGQLIQSISMSVYPRWRGEHLSQCQIRLSLCGLSPLARGTLTAAMEIQLPARFIPAGAGNTACSPARQDTISVYPRWRGEHTTFDSGYLVPFGLSPLARGTQTRVKDLKAAGRFIPAGAGNTRTAKNCCRAIAVYPRWRGEHSTLPRTSSTGGGLSPLARGTQFCVILRQHTDRFIPAGAGNTQLRQG